MWELFGDWTLVTDTGYSDGIGKHRIADLAMSGQKDRWAHPPDNTTEPRIGWVLALVMQIAVAGIVAQRHRMTELEAAVGRYTPFVTCIAGNSVIAVALDRSPVDTAVSYSAIALVGIVHFADTQNPQTPDDVPRRQKPQLRRLDSCPSSSELAQAVPARYLPVHLICSSGQSSERSFDAHTVFSDVRHLPFHSSGQDQTPPAAAQESESDLPVRLVGSHRLPRFRPSV